MSRTCARAPCRFLLVILLVDHWFEGLPEDHRSKFFVLLNKFVNNMNCNHNDVGVLSLGPRSTLPTYYFHFAELE